MAARVFDHVSFTVSDLDRSVDFYRRFVGLHVKSRARNSGKDLGMGLFGPPKGIEHPSAVVDIAWLEADGVTLELIQYVDPPTMAYHGDPSIAGSAHLALRIENLDQEYERLTGEGVDFHSPVNTFQDEAGVVWKWCYFRDPDGICVELLEQLEEGR